MQFSFNSGEWAPALNARVDIAKYHNGAALLRNFFVDYRGGATARPGTKYIIQTRHSSAVRLIPFQASLSVSYVLEFGDGYIRFINDGSPVLESDVAMTGIINVAGQANIQIVNNYAIGDWVFISGVGGATQLNNNYYIISARDPNNIRLTDLFGNAVLFASLSPYTAGGTIARIYTIPTIYAADELSLIKYAQNVDTLILCHPNHPPLILTLITATNWTIVPITFGTTIGTPGGLVALTTLAAGNVYYAYIVTAVDNLGQESAQSVYATIGPVTDIRTVAGTNTIAWLPVTGAVSYNVYRAEPSYNNPVPPGSSFGFIGNVLGTSMIDSNIGPDFSSGPPIIQNPFTTGDSVATVYILTSGTYTTVPTITFSASPGVTATGTAVLHCNTAAIAAAGINYVVGDTIVLASGVVLQVSTVGGGGTITGISIINQGSVLAGPVPANPVAQTSTSGIGTGGTFNLTWGLARINIVNPGSGYTVAPTITISGAGGGSAIAQTGSSSVGNPTVPGFFQQRLVLAGPTASPQQFNMSQPGAYFNFNTSSPAEPDNAIQGVLTSGQLNIIQSMIVQPQGLIILSDKQAWLMNGGSPGSPISATQIVANSQAYNGASFPPPIVANDNILYVQSKSSIVRDLVFNFYTQVYTGTDISVLSSHLFYGFSVLEWAWAEEPFKVVWAVRNDGDMLTLTFLKEQDLIAWAHSDTQGSFKSVATVVEAVPAGQVDAVYTVVQRTINGVTVQYIERFAELFYPNGVADAWCVDAGLSYNGAPATIFSGAQHLAGATVTGLADGIVIPPFVMPVNGTFVLGTPASKVTVGLAYTPQLQTLHLATGEPTIQGKMKSIPAVTVRVHQTLGLSIGKTFGTLLPMKDLVRGNVGSATNTRVTDLVTGDAMTRLDPSWTVPGQYCIEQPFPFPASILGVIPQVTPGDTAK